MSSLAVDLETANPDAVTIANLVEVFCSEAIHRIRKSGKGIESGMALFQYQEGRTATEKDLELHCDLLEELLHARVRKTAVIMREAMLLLDERCDNELTKTANPLLKFAWGKVQSTVLSHIYGYCIRRVVPRKGKNGERLESTHIKCHAVHRLREAYRALQEQKDFQCPGSPWLEADDVDLTSPRLPEPPAGWSDSGQQEQLDLDADDEGNFWNAPPETVLDSPEVNAQPLADSFADAQQLEEAFPNAELDDEVVPPAQDYAPEEEVVIDVPSDSQETPADPFAAALGLCEQAMAISASSNGHERKKKTYRFTCTRHLKNFCT